ncbi:uncharacterized protein Dwil_GK27303 [Drosophila willistoni]|uniref:Uncharacterized protein n=1 Tax=Drosophila willistoni TaxID=7260 RepID=A0A0Q9WNQ6_DROWI|nr:uncharacterized protein LOC26529305 [Drosophila willistoni]KRF97479.1 uncharacterized protein Dwil_GK27303 [Drosophila willistoni]
MPIPEYKPPKEIQDLLDQRQTQQQGNQQRRRTAVLPKRSWIQRNPRLFQITALTTSLLIFFSKPIYDIFIADPLPLPPAGETRVPPHKR